MVKEIFRHTNAWLFIIIIFCFADSNAQTISLYDAVNKAIVNYPLLQQRRHEVAAGQAHVKTVKGNTLPSLTLQEQLDASTTNALQGDYLSLGIVPSGPGGNPSAAPNYNPNPSNLAISYLNWEFYNFGYNNALKREANAQLAVNQANLGSDKYSVSEQVIALYLDWLKKYRVLQITQENVQRAQTVYNSIRATVLSGLRPGVDSSTASAVYADARIAYLQALDEYNADRFSLLGYTGMEGNIVPDTAFINTALLQGLPAVQPTDSVPVTHPLLDVYEKQYEQQLATNNAISKKYLPKLGLDAAAWERSSGISYTGTYPNSLFDGMPYSKNNYLFGLNLSYNLFNLKHRHDELKEGEYNALARKDALQTQQVNLNRILLQLNSSYETTLAKLKELPIQVNSLQQAYTQQLALYRSGLNTLPDLTTAQYFLVQAETNYVIAQDALLQLIFARAGLAGVTDTLLQNFKH